jgi:hypothetical protein
VAGADWPRQPDAGKTPCARIWRAQTGIASWLLTAVPCRRRLVSLGSAPSAGDGPGRCQRRRWRWRWRWRTPKHPDHGPACVAFRWSRRTQPPGSPMNETVGFSKPRYASHSGTLSPTSRRLSCVATRKGAACYTQELRRSKPPIAAVSVRIFRRIPPSSTVFIRLPVRVSSPRYPSPFRTLLRNQVRPDSRCDRLTNRGLRRRMNHPVGRDRASFESLIAGSRVGDYRFRLINVRRLEQARLSCKHK